MLCQLRKKVHLLKSKQNQLQTHPEQDMIHQREKLLNNSLQEDRHLKNLKGDVHHKSSYQLNCPLGNGVEKNPRQSIHQGGHLDQYVLHLLNSRETVELTIAVAEDPEATHVNVIINLEVDLHMTVIGRRLEAGHVIVTRNPGVDHGNSLGLDHVSVLVDGAGHHVIEIDGVDHVINVGGVSHVIVSGGADHVKGIGGEAHVELVAAMIEEKALIPVKRKMKTVILKSELYIFSAVAILLVVKG